MDPNLLRHFKSALGSMGDTESSPGPKPLCKMMKTLAAALDGVELDPTETEEVWSEAIADDPNNPIRLEFGRRLRRWDSFEATDWSSETKAHSLDRRLLIYEKLEAPESLSDQITLIHPLARPEPEPIVISAEHEEWYTQERQDRNNFYWSHFSDYLEKISKWPSESIESLHKVTTSIVERVSDPEREEIYPARGLVVGYVQSGKTANFTAVTAKAVDAGYRLIIVLAGTLNVLRSQTQRRMDRELVGQEILKADGDREYVDDRDWPDKFVSYGGIPSDLGYFDISRMTDSKDDYQSLGRGKEALDFARVLPDRRFNHPKNLHRAPARLIVIKKNPKVMQKLNDDLGRLRAELAEIPTLIIDDESDQASVNTREPTSKEEKERTATNREIVNLLGILPRAQYIGYTATPFANVFVDPSDAEDLFPKDFIIGLNRPIGYMGVSDFFDFAEDFGDLLDDELPEGFQSNERAFVRNVRGDDEEASNLKRAILSFILSGALKLHRLANNVEVSADHHTMLVHKSVKQADHVADSEQVQRVYNNLKRGSAAFYADLKKIWLDDFKLVSEIREPGLPHPPSFDALKPFVDNCINRIEEDRPIRIVNGDKTYVDQLPDFDKHSIWGILVGGTKLSRGFTVEGLTISYYRRRIEQADTLMQVGRWFGFRRGYRDLVRLFLGREELDSRGNVFDLYEAFKSICRDEEVFREQLKRYAKKEGKDRILPRQVPPLVPSHMLRPTAKNKMFNSRLVYENFGGKRSEKGSTPDSPEERTRNAEALEKLLVGAEQIGRLELNYRLEKKEKWEKKPVQMWRTSKAALVEFMEAYVWYGGEEYFQRQKEFLSQTDKKDPEIDEVLIIAPQRIKSLDYSTWTASGEALSIWGRDRITKRRFGAISGSADRQIGNYFAGIANKVEEVDEKTEAFRQPRTAVMLVYPILPMGDDRLKGCEVADSEISVGVGIAYPKNGMPTEAVFEPVDPTKEDDVVLDVS